MEDKLNALISDAPELIIHKPPKSSGDSKMMIWLIGGLVISSLVLYIVFYDNISNKNDDE